MLERIRDFLTALNLTPDDPVLVAVSGGMDSMVLLHMLHRIGIRVAVAHCNFGLRGKESDEDEKLVRDYCQQRGIPFHTTRFDTKAHAEKSNSSVQMVARDLRYGFFKDLMGTHSYRLTALAHHADDRIETLVLNVLRGTGLRGLQGMPSVRGPFIRPLITYLKKELEEFAAQHEIPFREDASNSDAKYRRNRVRLHLLPMLRLLRPDAEKRLLHFAERVENSISDFDRWVDVQRNHLSTFHDNTLHIDREKLNVCPYPFTILKEIIGPMGFSSEQVFELLQKWKAQSGILDSASHRIFIEKDAFVIFGKDVLETTPRFSVERMLLEDVRSLDTPPDTIIVDAGLVNPDRLSVRKWAEGDRFRPFGMKGTKKLSDYLIDNKFTASQKATTWLLMDGENIVWVMGHRMDDRFKVTDRTKQVLRIRFQRCTQSDLS